MGEIKPRGFVFQEAPIPQIHLYEFRSDKRKLTCSCGWARTLKSSDAKAVNAAVDLHRVEAAS